MALESLIEKPQIQMMSTDQSELQLLFDTGSIAPFDRSLATISLRSNANTPVDGYPVFVSVNFGSQIVKITSGTTEFDVVFSVHEAEIQLTWKGCDVDFGEGYHHHNAILNQMRGIETVDAEKRASSREVRPKDFQLGANTEVESRKSVKFDGLDKSYEHAGVDLIKIGSRKLREPLTGSVVRDYNAWFVSPASSSDISGVRVELNVREDWVSFRDPKTESETLLGRLHRAVMSSDAREHRHKKELFTSLLKVLSLRGLKSASGGRVATLDVSGVLCLPSASRPKAENSNSSGQGHLDANEALLLQFLQCPEGAEEATYKSIVDGTANTKRSGVFVPLSSVLNAREAYANLIQDEIFGIYHPRHEAVELYGRNEIRDLSSLKLLNEHDGKMAPSNPYPHLDAESSFKALVSRTDTIQFVRDLLIDEPRIRPIDIGERVATYLSKNWKEWSKKSYGHRLRTWTAFAYQEVLVTEKGEPLDRIVNGFSDNKRRRGQPGYLSGKNLDTIREYKREGLKISEMAKLMNISQAVISNFKRNHRDEWDAL